MFRYRTGSLWGESLEVYKAGVGAFLSFPFFQSGEWRKDAFLA